VPGSFSQVGARLREIRRYCVAVEIELAQTRAGLRDSASRGFRILRHRGLYIDRGAQATVERMAIPVGGMRIARVGQSSERGGGGRQMGSRQGSAFYAR
jgi:hypothetical protein